MYDFIGLRKKLPYNKAMNALSFPLPDDVRQAIARLNAAGYEAFLVGGAVRDFLLGNPVHDFDLTTSAAPAETMAVFQSFRTIPAGLRHGTITVVFPDRRSLEITTYRTETTYQDHRHPDQVIFTRSLQEDCARRDFTINALCYHPHLGIRDFFHGRDDLEKHLVRTVGDPRRRFEEDALRILRALRFAAKLDFTIAPETEQCLHAQADLLNYISRERIRDELHALLAGRASARVLREHQDVLAAVLPYINDLSSSAWQARTEAVARTGGSPAAAAAILLDEEDIARAVLHSLKCSRLESRRVLGLVTLKNAPLKTDTDLVHLLHDLQVPAGLYLSYRGALDPDLDTDAIRLRLKKLQAQGVCCSLKDLALHGEDLITLPIPAAARGKYLNLALEEVMSGRLPNEKKVLLHFLQETAENADKT
jgi:tRNA nucleotidyltransferase (CCA-adding enzyme)